jgi:hypothetical protein
VNKRAVRNVEPPIVAINNLLKAAPIIVSINVSTAPATPPLTSA